MITRLASLLVCCVLSMQAAEPAAMPPGWQKADPTHGRLAVRKNAIEVWSYRWDTRKTEPLTLTALGQHGVTFTGNYNRLSKMYVVEVPEGFDGSFVLDSDRNSDFSLQAWPVCPTLAELTRGTFKHVSMGNSISFRNIEPKPSKLYVSVRAHTSIPGTGLPFTITVRARQGEVANKS